MSTSTIAIGVATLVALGLYLMRRRSRLNKDE
jgi:LPXTG-motif cell wall-anchored protein